MSTFAVCLVEFLLFLGAPLLRSLKALIAAALVQLRIALAEALAATTFGDGAAAKTAAIIAITQQIVDTARNVIAALPVSAFRDCTEVALMLSTIQSAFAPVFTAYDDAVNEQNRVRTFQNTKSTLSSDIEEQIQYLEDLNSQIDLAIAELARRGAASI